MAVFGGNTVPTAVREAARVIAGAVLEGGALLLTGGDGTDGAGVKDQARLAVAGRGRWVGIAFAGTGSTVARRTDDGIVVEPGLGHQRNLLEACLCDAAVVLPGGIGTVSEGLAALGLGRPVLLIGDAFAGAPDADVLPRLVRGEHVDAAALDGWCRAARARVRGPSAWLHGLGEEILRPDRVRAGLATGGARPLSLAEVSRDRVRTWIHDAHRRPGRWPAALRVGDLAGVAAVYDAWRG